MMMNTDDDDEPMQVDWDMNSEPEMMDVGGRHQRSCVNISDNLKHDKSMV